MWHAFSSTVPGKLLDVHWHTSIIVTVRLDGETNSAAIPNKFFPLYLIFLTFWVLIACSPRVWMQGEQRRILFGPS
jgi:hypothetical protein